jgi:NDMA-dependent alcohol dehydrogenase
MRTWGAVVWGRDQPWSIEEIEVDEPSAGEVLVEWAAGGLCRSDDHLRSGDRVADGLDDAMYPLLGGHEGAGTVVALGPGVSTVEVGDHVCGSFIATCGHCRYCASGRGHLCNAGKDVFGKGQLTDGVVRHRVKGEPLHVMAKLGTFAGHTVVAEESLIKIPSDVRLEAACIVSCGVSTGWGSAVERGGTEPGDVVVVVGTGGLGMSAVQGARLAGAAEIVAVEVNERRRELSGRFGATRQAASIAEAARLVDELTWGQGADRVILTASTVDGEMIRDGLAITSKGGVCVVTGMGPLGTTPVPLDIGAFALFNKELRGCLFGSLDPRRASPRLLELYRKGLLDLDGMISTYQLNQINEGYQDMFDGRNVRGVVLHAHGEQP